MLYRQVILQILQPEALGLWSRDTRVTFRRANPSSTATSASGKLPRRGRVIRSNNTTEADQLVASQVRSANSRAVHQRWPPEIAIQTRAATSNMPLADRCVLSGQPNTHQYRLIKVHAAASASMMAALKFHYFYLEL